MDAIVAKNFSPMKYKVWALNSKQMELARESEIIARLPNIPTRDLKRWSKGDSLVKFSQ
jgi:hypothetical protein